MELNLDIPQGHLFIRSVSAAGIRIDGVDYSAAIIISANQILPEWKVKCAAEINETTLQDVFNLSPEVVLIGCGKKQLFLPVAVQALFIQRNIGLEVMTSDAACRTFNVLVSEGRNVVAALLPLDG